MNFPFSLGFGCSHSSLAAFLFPLPYVRASGARGTSRRCLMLYRTSWNFDISCQQQVKKIPVVWGILMQRKQARQQNVKWLRVHLFFFPFWELPQFAPRRNAFFKVHTSESTRLTKKETVEAFRSSISFSSGSVFLLLFKSVASSRPPSLHPSFPTISISQPPLPKPPSLSRPRGITRVNCLVDAKSSRDDTRCLGPSLQLTSTFGRWAKKQKPEKG